MKAMKLFIGALALATMSLLSAPSVNAQENGNRDESGKVVRGPYLTNQFGDNWFINGSLGVISAYDNAQFHTGFGIDGNIGKWVTPSVGARMGLNGITKGAKDRFLYLHADVLWNISNAIGGYKETRLWDFVPYVHGGILEDAGTEFSAGAGLLNLIRLSDAVDLTLDFRGALAKEASNTSGKFGYISSTVGLSINLGKTINFIRASNWRNPKDVAALEAAAAAAEALKVANAALEADKKALQNENKALADKNAQLQNECAAAKEEVGLKDVEPASFYFEIGKSTLDQKELGHLEFYIKNVLPYVKDMNMIVITGTADKKTGSVKRNTALCQQRAEYIKNIMVDKYGFDADDFVVRTNLTTDGDAELIRAVVISFE